MHTLPPDVRRTLRARFRSRRVVPALLSVATLAAGAGGAFALTAPHAGGDSAANISVNTAGERVMARWVAARTGTISTLYLRVKVENTAGCIFGGRTGYAAGTSGAFRATTYRVLPDGRPDTAAVLGQTQFNPCQRQSGESVDIPLNIAVTKGQELATVVQNADGAPATNWFSTNHLYTEAGVLGANGRNERDPNATDAHYGLDPREIVGYSTDGGATWSLPGGPYGAPGGKSFIASYIQRYSDGAVAVRGDVRDAATVRPLTAGVDAVVHLAAIVGDPACSRDPELARSVNVDGSRVVIDACAEGGVAHFVFVSTCSNYGISEPGKLADGDDPLNPISLYAESKVEVERLLADEAPVPATCLRLATVYGVAPRMRLDLTVNQFAVEAETTRRLSIYGADHWRPYVHVEDVGRAIVTVLRHPGESIGRTFNVGDSEENYTKRMMYELLRDRVPDLDAEWVGTGPDLRSYRVSFARIGNELPFRISRRVPDGMDEVIEMSRRGGIGDIADPVYRN